MSEDPFLRELAQVIRDQEAEDRSRLDQRWDRLSSGQLSADEEAELRALAGTSTEAREAYEAFRPLGPEFQARVVQSIREQGLAPIAEPATVRPPAKLLPWRQRAVRWAGRSAAAAAAAAALLVSLRPPMPLPGYSLDLSGGSRAMRGEETEAPDFAAGDRFQAILRPETQVARAKSLEAQAFLLREGELRRLDVESQPVASGVVRLEGRLASDLAPGEWTLWAVVGRPGKLPRPDALRSFSTRAPVRQRDWVAVPREFRIRPPAP